MRTIWHRVSSPRSSYPWQVGMITLMGHRCTWEEPRVPPSSRFRQVREGGEHTGAVSQFAKLALESPFEGQLQFRLIYWKQDITAKNHIKNFDSPLTFLSPSLFSTEAFDLVLRHGRNSTLSLLRAEFPALGSGVHSLVGQLYMDMSLYILGSDSSVNHMVNVLYGRLFPLAYRRLLGGPTPSSVSEECLRGAWKDSGAFGPYPKLLMTRLSRSLLATRVFLQALNLGIEVVNTTDHLRPGRDCTRSLLRLWYCPHCQGQLEPVACKGLCQAVMQGCLGGAVEVQPHWRTYVEGLGRLAGGMRGEQDMEGVVLRLPSIIKLSLKHVVNAKTRITTLVSLLTIVTPIYY
uniref:Glypican-3 n=1 Tax=Periophthalmus magnuspinnatus TaxID=409849 RepID=A0A3B3ZGE7_9GOBI